MRTDGDVRRQLRIRRSAVRISLGALGSSRPQLLLSPSHPCPPPPIVRVLSVFMPDAPCGQRNNDRRRGGSRSSVNRPAARRRSGAGRRPRRRARRAGCRPAFAVNTRSPVVVPHSPDPWLLAPPHTWPRRSRYQLTRRHRNTRANAALRPQNPWLEGFWPAIVLDYEALSPKVLPRGWHHDSGAHGV